MICHVLSTDDGHGARLRCALHHSMLFCKRTRHCLPGKSSLVNPADACDCFPYVEQIGFRTTRKFSLCETIRGYGVERF